MRILPFLLLAGLVACNEPKEVIKPEYSRITQSVYASGVVKSKNQYQVFANSTGILAEHLVQEGDSVRKGQPILRLSNPALELTTQNARINATFNEVKNNKERLEELEQVVENARQQLVNDSNLVVRQRVLWSQNVGSKTELEQRELKFETSKTNFENATLRYQQLKKQLEFTERQTRTSQAISAANERELTVTSRINGRVYSLLKEVGEMVTFQTPLAIVGEAGFYLELQVDENDIGLIQTGQRVMVTMDSYKDQVFEAKVTKIYPIMNENSRSFTLEATFVSLPVKLYPNLTTEANIIITTRERALLIPRNYLMNGSAVLLRDGSKREVVTGLMDYQKVEILKGLTAEDELLKPAQ